MVYTLVRPSSLPYDGSAYASLLNFIPEAFTQGGNGSLADDVDSTYVNANSLLDDTGDEHVSLIAVDFPAVDVLSLLFGTMFRVARLADASVLNNSRWNVFTPGSATSILAFGDMHDVFSPKSPGMIPTTATSLTTGTDWYSLGGDADFAATHAAIAAGGLTLVFSASSLAATRTDIYRIFECGLLLDLGGSRRPSLRQLHRGGRGGIGGIPRAVGDRTVYGSPRRGPGLVR